MNKDTNNNISVIGLGKLGACFASFYADNGFNVTGVDVDAEKVDKINNSTAPVEEPELQKLITKNKERITATTNFKEAVQKTGATFIIVPTPSDESGRFSVEYVLDAAKKMAEGLNHKDSYHLFVLVSTVLPEDSRGKIIPALEKYSGKKRGKDFGYCYSPSLIALGSVIKNLREPDFLFLGSYDEKSEKMLNNIYGEVYNSEDKIKPMSVESAELAKISLNAFVTMKIAFANTLGEVSDKTPNCDVDEVTNAIGADKRIGNAFFKSGLGYGGPCFPRDNYAFAGMAKDRGVETPLALTTHRLNESMPAKIVKIIESNTEKYNASVGILGIAYKPDTPVTEESQAVKIAKNLAENNYSVNVYDRMGYEYAEKDLGNSVNYMKNKKDLVSKSDIFFISNPDKDFKNLPNFLQNTRDKKVIVDPWGMFSSAEFSENIKYIPVGRCS